MKQQAVINTYLYVSFFQRLLLTPLLTCVFTFYGLMIVLAILLLVISIWLWIVRLDCWTKKISSTTTTTVLPSCNHLRFQDLLPWPYQLLSSPSCSSSFQFVNTKRENYIWPSSKIISRSTLNYRSKDNNDIRKHLVFLFQSLHILKANDFFMLFYFILFYFFCFFKG